MIDNIEQQTDAGPGGTAYSVLTLAPQGLAFQYKRATAKIAANVVKATNGETSSEILGAGDAARPMQTFTPHQKPLTFVSAPTVSGVVSTLAVRVSDVLWHEIDTLADAAPEDRIYVTKTADDGKVSIIFGDGKAGSRLPTGADNVRAVYRSGIGRGGNVRAGQIATAISRPLGVRDVLNPLAAYGGADPESRDDARRNIPVSLQAMGRVVSVTDYADFARTFAGISKATAAAISDKRQRLVLLTVGGAGDIEIDVTSDLYRNLGDALRRYGDPYQPFLVLPREKIVIAGAARVRVDPDYLWAIVAPNIRAALLDRFCYDRRDFAQPVYPAEVVATIQGVAGVASVDLTALTGIRSSHLVDLSDASTEAKIAPKLPALDKVIPIIPRPSRRSHHQLRAAQIAYLPPELADLFVLTEIIHD
jgi:predicted phage baseplate assembly protein